MRWLKAISGLFLVAILFAVCVGLVGYYISPDLSLILSALSPAPGFLYMMWAIDYWDLV